MPLAELRLLLRNPAYWLLLALFAALLAVSAFLTHHHQAASREQQHAYQKLVRSQWENQPDRHPHRVAHYGTFAFRLDGPLSGFDPGVGDFSGRVQYLEAHRQNTANFAEASALSSAFRLGKLTPAFVFQVLFPLLLIALGHRLVADEFTSKRIGLLLAQGISLRSLALGKTLGLALAALPFLALGAVAVAAPAVLTPSTDTLARALLLFLALLLHALGWVAVIGLFSLVCRTAPRALLALVSLWVATTLVLPRVGGALAAHLHPLPSKTAFAATVEADIAKLGDSHNPDDPSFRALREETLTRFGVTRIEDLPINYNGLVMARGEEQSALTFARHFDQLLATMRSQEDVLRHAAFASPFLGLRGLSAALCGTDLRAQSEFQLQAEAYRFDFVQRLNTFHRDKINHAEDRNQRLSADHWHTFPDFSPQPPRLGAALADSAPAWLALALWLLAPLVLIARQKGFCP